MKNLKAILDNINYHKRFDISQDQNLDFSINLEDLIKYPKILISKRDEFEKTLKDLLQIVDKKIQNKLFNRIYTELNQLKAAKFDKNNYPFKEIISDIKENDEILPPLFSFEPFNNYQICECYSKYINSIESLKESFNDILNYGGYKIKLNKLVGPLDSKEISLNRLETKLNIDEFGFLLFLLQQSDIFKNTTKAEIADMVSKNFINSAGNHFSKHSIENRIKDTKSSTISKKIKEVLKQILKNIKL